jgi:O-antigen ligase
MDLGLWLRMSVLGAYGAGLTAWYWKSIETKLTPILVFTLGLLLWPILHFGDVPAQSEWWGYTARIAVLFSVIVGSSAAFKKDLDGSLAAIKLGSQLALFIVSLSLFGALTEAYKAGDIYLANGPLFTHKNYAAATLLLLLPLGLLPNPQGSKSLDIAGVATMVLALMTVLLLRTRGVWMAAVVMALISVTYYALLKNKQHLRRNLIILGVLAIGFVGVIAVGGQEKIFNSSTIQTRMHYWNASLEMYLDHPITGVGAGQWKVFYPSTGLAGTNEAVMNGSTAILRPHNDLLWMMSEIGVGALFFIGILVSGFFISIRKGGQLPMALTIVAFTVYGFAEFPIERATMIMPLGVALGYAHSRSRSWLTLPQSVFGGLAIVLGLGGSYISSERNAGEEKAQEVIAAYSRQNASAMVKAAKKSESEWFEMDIYNNPIAYFEGLGQLQQGGQRPSKNQLNSALKTLERAHEIHPYHMLTMNQMAQIYRIKGQVKLARDMYKEVVEMSPHNTTALLGLMESERTLGNVYGALNALVDISPKYTFKNLPGYRPEALKTLQAFARLGQPRNATRDLHQQLNTAPQNKMWQIWTEFRQIHHKK